MFLACLTLIFMTSCVAPVASECGWAREIVVNDGDIITRPTAEQIVAHNRKVRANCR